MGLANEARVGGVAGVQETGRDWRWRHLEGLGDISARIPGGVSRTDDQRVGPGTKDGPGRDGGSRVPECKGGRGNWH